MAGDDTVTATVRSDRASAALGIELLEYGPVRRGAEVLAGFHGRSRQPARA